MVTSDSQRVAVSRTVNPYAPTAVASITGEGQVPVTVATSAVRLATGYLDEYLNTYVYVASGKAPTSSGKNVPSPGNVIAIVGDYGTGKTHLADHLMIHLRERMPENSHALYIEASRSGSFLSIYQEFMRILQTQHDLVARVREYYTDVVADWLQASTLFGPEIAEGLREGQTTTHHLAKTYGLTESSHQQELQRRLHHVTRNKNISRALVLLTRDGFQDDVLSWLRGDAPTVPLQERNITERIGSDAAALEAMGVFALLYGHRNHRFLLIIDEIEKLLLATSRSAGGIDGLKKLLEVFAAARGFLVLVGLPDIVQLIGESTFQRLGNVISMPALGKRDVEQLVLVSHERTLGTRTLEPFTVDGVSYLTQLVGGVPRQVIRLLHRCYAEATVSGRTVTQDMIREGAPGFALFTRDHVITSIRHLANGEALRSELDRRLVLGDPVRADVWVPAPRLDNVGAAFIVADCVLTSSEASHLADVARRIRTGIPGALVRLVVASWLAPEVEEQLIGAYGAAPLVYQPNAAFDKALLAVIREATGRTTLPRTADAAHLPASEQGSAVEDELEQLRLQHDGTRAVVEQLAGAIDSLRSTWEHRFDSLQSGIGRLRGDFAEVHRLPPEVELPAQVQVHFDEATDALNEVFRLNVTLAAAFELGTEGAPLRTHSASDLVDEGRKLLGGAHTAEVIGVLASVSGLIGGFRRAVITWYERFDSETSSTSAAADDALRSICGTYDDLFEPLERRLGGWDRLAGWWAPPTGLAVRSVSGGKSTLQRGQDLRSLLSGLGVAVQRSARQRAH